MASSNTTVLIFSVFTIVFFGLNYPWTQAAIAGSISGAKCPETISERARSKLATLYPDTVASPVFVCLTEPSMGVNISHGTTHFAPFLSSIVVLGPKGQNDNVAAHEFAHAELAQRTSVLLRTYRIPTWFDEGLAMQFDHRPDYSNAALKQYLGANTGRALRLRDLRQPKQFYQKGAGGKAHYAFAKCVVGAWLNAKGRRQLQTLIAGVGWQTPFPEQQFGAYETTCNI